MSHVPPTASPSIYPRRLFDLPNMYTTATWCQPLVVNPRSDVQRCQSLGRSVVAPLPNRKLTRVPPLSPFSRRA
jgi:hypothetical protein